MKPNIEDVITKKDLETAIAVMESIHEAAPGSWKTMSANDLLAETTMHLMIVKDKLAGGPEDRREALEEEDATVFL